MDNKTSDNLCTICHKGTLAIIEWGTEKKHGKYYAECSECKASTHIYNTEKEVNTAIDFKEFVLTKKKY